jgi:hypothetical protein
MLQLRHRNGSGFQPLVIAMLFPRSMPEIMKYRAENVEF